MDISKETTAEEGLKFTRFAMVLSSVAPLFLLWAIRGANVIPDCYFIAGCLLLATLPTGFLLLRLMVAKRSNDTRSLVVGSIEDNRGHVLAYLFAMLLPFYRQNIDSWRDFSAMLVALGFILFLFWHLNYHYMNILFAIRGYRVLTIQPPQDSEYSGRTNIALITKRSTFPNGKRLLAYRLSNTVYLEKVT